MNKSKKKVINIILFSISALLWAIWIFPDRSPESLMKLRDENREHLTPMKKEITLVPGYQFKKEFFVKFEDPYTIGIYFNDSLLRNFYSKENFNSIPGFKYSWTIYENENMIAHFTDMTISGSYGYSLKLGDEFHCEDDKTYIIHFKILSIPDDFLNHKAKIEVVNDHAATSCGLELGYGLTLIFIKFFYPIILVLAIIFSLIAILKTLDTWYLNKVKKQ